MLMSVVASLLVLLGAIHFWPIPVDDEPPDLTYSTRGKEYIQIEEIQQTRHEKRKPPPPRPMIPVVVPDDVVLLEEEDLDLQESLLTVDDPGDEEEVVEGDIGESLPMASAETAPKPVRFVEPEYTREARRKKVRAEVTVEVLVNERGAVEEAKVLERFLLGKEDTPKTPVEHVGYGLEESALSAAQRWRFRPARQGGKAVRSYTTLTFSFGV